jgi:hypothetical protein
MTPEERFEAHEQWRFAIRQVLTEIEEIQQQQRAVLREIAERAARRRDRDEGGDADAP